MQNKSQKINFILPFGKVFSLALLGTSLAYSAQKFDVTDVEVITAVCSGSKKLTDPAGNEWEIIEKLAYNGKKFQSIVDHQGEVVKEYIATIQTPGAHSTPLTLEPLAHPNTTAPEDVISLTLDEINTQTKDGSQKGVFGLNPENGNKMPLAYPTDRVDGDKGREILHFNTIVKHQRPADKGGKEADIHIDLYLAHAAGVKPKPIIPIPTPAAPAPGTTPTPAADPTPTADSAPETTPAPAPVPTPTPAADPTPTADPSPKTTPAPASTPPADPAPEPTPTPTPTPPASDDESTAGSTDDDSKLSNEDESESGNESANEEEKEVPLSPTHKQLLDKWAASQDEGYVPPEDLLASISSLSEETAKVAVEKNFTPAHVQLVENLVSEEGKVSEDLLASVSSLPPEVAEFAVEKDFTPPHVQLVEHFVSEEGKVSEDLLTSISSLPQKVAEFAVEKGGLLPSPSVQGQVVDPDVPGSTYGEQNGKIYVSRAGRSRPFQ